MNHDSALVYGYAGAGTLSKQFNDGLVEVVEVGSGEGGELRVSEGEDVRFNVAMGKSESVHEKGRKW